MMQVCERCRLPLKYWHWNIDDVRLCRECGMPGSDEPDDVYAKCPHEAMVLIKGKLVCIRCGDTIMGKVTRWVK